MLRALIACIAAGALFAACTSGGDDATPTPEPTAQATPETAGAFADNAEYSIELLDIVRDMTTMNEGVAEQYLSYVSCASTVSCLSAAEALMPAFRQSRPALVDLVERAEALSERSNPTYDDFLASLLRSFRLRLEGQDDIVEGWETGNDAQFNRGGEKFDEGGSATFRLRNRRRESSAASPSAVRTPATAMDA